MSRTTALWSAAILTVLFALVFGVILLRPAFQAQAQAQPAQATYVDPAPASTMLSAGQNQTVVDAGTQLQPQAEHESKSGSFGHQDTHEHGDDHD